MINIEFKKNHKPTLIEFKELLISSGLGERRPMENDTCLQGMLDHANLIITAWHANQLVGISRSITDYHYACYLSDLAVDQSFQKAGLGKELMQRTQDELGPLCNLILIAAPNANDYYPRVGFENNKRTWTLSRNQRIN